MGLFTKSAFKEALLCPARLNYYHNDEYANQAVSDEFLKALANGGFQVEELAKIYHKVPAENDLKNESGRNDTSARTDELMLLPNVIMAEATFKWQNCSVRADIIKKNGNFIDLLEIKAKSWGGEKNKWVTTRANGEEPKGSVQNEIRPYVYDVAFQKYVITNYLKERFPGQQFTVRAALLMADKSKLSNVDHLNQFFKIREIENQTEIEKQPGWEVLQNTNVEDQILTPFYYVDELCDRIIDGTSPEQRVYLRGYNFKDFVQEMSSRYVNRRKSFTNSCVSTECYKCPYYTVNETDKKDGYDECWKELTKDFSQCYKSYTEKPLLEDLWGGGNTKAKGDILKAQKIFLEQLTQDDLPIKSVESGLHYNDRKRIQVALATGNSAIAGDLASEIAGGLFLDVDGLKNEMSRWEFPLHMIDFETSAAALPFYEGMSPYEQVAFQFSHHTISKDESGKYHVAHAHQWINVSSEFPNFEFVRQLRNAVGNTGTIFRYSNHENSILRTIRAQLETQAPVDAEELISFIDSITHPTKDETGHVRGPRDMVDLCEIVKKYYYDPIMGGSNSIKAVLPAVLKSDFLFERYSKPIYGRVIPSLNFSEDQPKQWIVEKGDNPYKHLPTVSEYFPEASRNVVQRVEESTEEEESFGDSQVNNGGAALWAYNLLQFKLQQPKERDALVKALLQYCELDTLSMVFIWEFFNSHVNICECGCDNTAAPLELENDNNEEKNMSQAKKVFKMPKPVKITGRTSSITNSFVNGIIPVVNPNETEIKEALETLGMSEESICCAYCGDTCTEWDHFHPLVKDKQPTGYISEIHNLVPACSKCNESKGCREWSEWINSAADKSPKTRGIADLETRIGKLKEYEEKYPCQMIDFKTVVGEEEWNLYWSKKDAVLREMESAQRHANIVKEKILRHFNGDVQNDLPETQMPDQEIPAQQSESMESQTVVLPSTEQSGVFALATSDYDYEDFKDWMSLDGMGQASIRNYCCALNRILEDADMDFEEFAACVNEMRPLYRDGGAKASLGKIYSGAGKAVVNKLYDYVLEKTVDARDAESSAEADVVDSEIVPMETTATAIVNTCVNYDSAEFKSWMIDKGYSVNSVNSYMVALRKILVEDGREFHEFASCIDSLVPLYLNDGAKEELGNLYHAAGRAVIKLLASYVHSKQTSDDNDGQTTFANDIEPTSDVVIPNYSLDDFKTWLVEHVRKAGTMNNYMCALRRILADAQMDFVEFATHVADLAPSYQRGGEKEELGNVYSGAGKAVIAKIVDYFIDKN